MIKIFSFFKHIQGTLGYSDYTINMKSEMYTIYQQH